MNGFLLKIICLILIVFSTSVSQARNIIIGIEGIPGCGKTSSLLSLAQRLSSKCIILSEINPDSPSDWTNLNKLILFKKFHKKWVKRVNAINLFNRVDKDVCFISDRTFYSNLAYLYALDYVENTNYYPSQLKLHKKDFNNINYFDHLIILISDPIMSLVRRKKYTDSTTEFHKKKLFLEKFEEFYIKQLPTLLSSSYTIINTDKLSRKEVEAKLIYIIESFVGQTKEINTNIHKDNIQKILLFGRNNGLGDYVSKPVLINCIPTIYYEKHSVQLKNGYPVFFDNQQLMFLSKQKCP